MSVSSVMSGSPVVGLGTTRNVQGSFYSIAGGDTAACPTCTPPALGTQGHFWLVIYSTGLGGLLLYLGFVLVQFFRHVAIHGPPVTLGLAVLVVHLATMFVYDTIGVALVLIFLAIGLMWRERAAVDAAGKSRLPSLGGYAHLVRSNAAAIAVCVLVGLFGGLAYQHHRGIDATSTTTVLVPLDPVYVTSPSRPQTLDTIAALIDSPGVLSEVSRAAGRPVSSDDPALYVTATANTRLLRIHFVDRNPTVSANSAEAAGRALIAVRTSILSQQRDRVVASLQKQQEALLQAIAAIDRNPATHARKSAERHALVVQANETNRQLTQVASVQVNGGVITDHATTTFASDRWLVAGCSGVMLGLAAGLLIGLARRLRGVRLSRRRPRGHFGGLPVLARVRPPEAPLAQFGGTELLSAGRDPSAQGWAREMSVRTTQAGRSGGGRPERAAPAVVVAGPRDRDIDIRRLHRGLVGAGVDVRGLVLVGERPSETDRTERLTLSQG
jgi:hypothetical protein